VRQLAAVAILRLPVAREAHRAAPRQQALRARQGLSCQRLRRAVAVVHLRGIDAEQAHAPAIRQAHGVAIEMLRHGGLLACRGRSACGCGRSRPQQHRQKHKRRPKAPFARQAGEPAAHQALP
jgi:hypothetical protein